MIDSVINQTYEHWELIIVDDGSTDDTKDFVLEYTDERIYFFENGGIGIIAALQTAWAKSSGIYISRMDGDDIMPKDKLLNLVKLQNQQQGVIATGKVKYFSAENISLGYQKYEAWLNHVCDNQMFDQEIFRECVVASGNWLALKTDLELVGFPSQLQYPEDYDLVFRWYRAGFVVKGVDSLTHLWREHPERTSRNSEVYDQKSFFDLKLRYWLDIHQNQKIEIVLFGVNQKSKIVMKCLKDHGLSFVLTSIDSNQIGQELEDVTVFSLNDLQFDSENQQILILVYPEAPIRKSINDFVAKKGFLLGENCWWF